MRYKIVAVLLGLLFLTACSRNLELTPYYKTVAIRIIPSYATVEVGSTFKFKSEGIDEIGNIKELSQVEWWVLAWYTGTIEADGTFTAQRVARGEVYASAEGFTATATVDVTAGSAASIEVYPKDLTLALGDKIKLYGYVNDAYGNRLEVITDNPEYWKADETVLTIDSSTANAVYVIANASGNGWVEVTWEGVVERVTIPVNDVPRYSYITQWVAKAYGTAEVFPVGISWHSGDVWVTLYDTYEAFDCLQKYDSSGNLLSTLGTSGTGEGEFKRPNDLVFDGSGNMYVADLENYRIQKFSSSGSFITSWGTYGSGDGQFKYPARIAIHNDYVYVSDYSGHGVQKFDLDGNFILKWGNYGENDGEFRNPSGIAVDSSGNVYVADQSNDRIQKFDSNGNFIKKWGNRGYSIGQFIHIVGLAVDADDNVYVADAGADFISKFDKDGNFITRWGGYGSGNGLLDGPFDITIDNSGRVYVVDFNNKRIQKFSP